MYMCMWQSTLLGLKVFKILSKVDIDHYIITQVIVAFWLVLDYDLLEDRSTIDVIISKFFPSVF